MSSAAIHKLLSRFMTERLTVLSAKSHSLIRLQKATCMSIALNPSGATFFQLFKTAPLLDRYQKLHADGSKQISSA